VKVSIYNTHNTSIFYLNEIYQQQTMDIHRNEILVPGTKFYIKEGNDEIARVYFYQLDTDLDKRPLGHMEDLFVNEELRKQGIGSQLIQRVIDETAATNCHRITAMARYEQQRVHDLYKKLGFTNRGRSYRIDF